MNNPVVYSYKGSEISFMSGESTMINATQMAKPFGKRPNDYLVLPSTNQLINAITRKSGIAENQLVITERGGLNPGTWLHEDIALDFAQWLSVDFRLWCNDRIKELLKTGVTTVSNDDEAIAYAMQVLNRRLEQAKAEKKQLEQQNAKLQPKAAFADAAFATDDKVDIGMSAKILKLGFGRNTLFDKLRKAGVFFANRNEPKQRFIDAGYFEMKEKFIERNNHPGFVVTKVLVTQKGLAYLNHLFGGNPSDGKLASITSPFPNS